LRLDKFIDLALYERNGYYLNKKPIGRKFDFVTSPEISQMFGEIIGVYLVYHWKEKINCKDNPYSDWRPTFQTGYSWN